MKRLTDICIHFIQKKGNLSNINNSSGLELHIYVKQLPLAGFFFLYFFQLHNYKAARGVIYNEVTGVTLTGSMLIDVSLILQIRTCKMVTCLEKQ